MKGGACASAPLDSIEDFGSLKQGSPTTLRRAAAIKKGCHGEVARVGRQPPVCGEGSSISSRPTGGPEQRLAGCAAVFKNARPSGALNCVKVCQAERHGPAFRGQTVVAAQARVRGWAGRSGAFGTGALRGGVEHAVDTVDFALPDGRAG